MICPHCQATVDDAAAFCTSCGKALQVSGGGPRIVDRTDLATSLTGQTLQSEELKKLMKRSFGALLAVAILQTLAMVLIFALVGSSPGGLMITLVLAVVAALFYGLAFWSRKQPFPAAITGLVILVTLWLIDFAMNPASLLQGVLIKIIILAVLIRAVQAGITHRKLSRQMTPGQTAQI